MAFTYNATPGTPVPRDRLRLMLADNIEATALFQDEDLDIILVNQSGNLWWAAAEACEMLAMRFAGMVDRSMGNTSVSASQRSKAYSERAEAFRKQATVMARRNMSCAVFYAGGRSHAEKRTAAMNPDAVQPAFRVGQNQYASANPRCDGGALSGAWDKWGPTHGGGSNGP